MARIVVDQLSAISYDPIGIANRPIWISFSLTSPLFSMVRSPITAIIIIWRRRLWARAICTKRRFCSGLLLFFVPIVTTGAIENSIEIALFIGIVAHSYCNYANSTNRACDCSNPSVV